MEYKEILESARTCIGPYCKACPVCNGKACGNQVPGPGAKAPGNGFTRNYDAWQKICVNMDTICPNEPVDTAVELFGTMYRYPFFAAPLGAMKMHYGDKYNDREYNSILVNACADSGIAAFTGDGVDAAVFQGAMEAIRAAGGVGVPTIKPWSQQLVFEKLDLARTSGCKAVAMDIDGAGLPFLKNLTPPAGSKSVQELSEIIRRYQPEEASIEELFFNNNAKTAILVGEARGVAVLACAQAGLAISEYTPLQIKQALVGYGRADKKQMQAMVKAILNLEAVPKPDDTADALAAAICHGHAGGHKRPLRIRSGI